MAGSFSLPEEFQIDGGIDRDCGLIDLCVHVVILFVFEFVNLKKDWTTRLQCIKISL